MTELLYYKDAYIKEFDATVISCDECDEGYLTVLDRTAFFPEEGGQYADTGFIAGARVTDGRIKDGVVYHLTDTALTVGEEVHCTLDFDGRFEKMQCHSAEHLLSGLIHTHFGFDNVGFHLSREYVTFDVSAPLLREQLDFIETLANLAVYENRKITAAFPTPEELSGMDYRAKLELSENVRIVTVDGYDACACCAPHVCSTGEIGVIKLLDFEKHKGGVRIYMTAGKRALIDYRARYTAIRKISEILSEPQATVADAVSARCKALSELEYKLREARLAIVDLRAEAIPRTDGNAVALLQDFSDRKSVV